MVFGEGRLYAWIHQQGEDKREWQKNWEFLSSPRVGLVFHDRVVGIPNAAELSNRDTHKT